MRARSSLGLTLLMLRASAALALTAVPLHLSFDGAMPKLVTAAAMADDDDSGSDHSGSDDHGGSGGSDHGGGGGNSGSGGDDDDDNGSDDHGGGHDSGNGNGNSGRGGGNGRDDSDNHDNDREHVNRLTGNRVEIGRNSIEVVHRDGTKEELDNGIYEMKDARGRTIIERRATARDIARMNDLAR